MRYSTANKPGDPPGRRSRRLPSSPQRRSLHFQGRTQRLRRLGEIGRAHACAESLNANSRVNAMKDQGRGKKAIRTIHPPQGRQSLISAPSCYKTCNLCRWESNPPRPVHTHTRTPTHTRVDAITDDPWPCLSSHHQRPAPMPPMPPMPPCPHARPHELGGVFFLFAPAPSAAAQGHTQGMERSTPPRGSGVPEPTKPYFPKQISEGCHPTEACLRPTVSSRRRRYVLH